MELIHVPIASEAERTQALCAAVSDGVRVLAVSHVHWRTGTRVDPRATPGALPATTIAASSWMEYRPLALYPYRRGLPMPIAASVFKWLLSGFGLGFVTVSERLAEELHPVLRGYNNEPPSRSVRYGSHQFTPGVYALQASLEFMRSLGWDKIHAQVDGLALRAIASPAEPWVRRHNAAQCSWRHRVHSTSSGLGLVSALAEQSIFVEDRGPVLRVSAHFYNTDEDIDRFVSALARCA